MLEGYSLDSAMTVFFRQQGLQSQKKRSSSGAILKQMLVKTEPPIKFEITYAQEPYRDFAAQRKLT